MDFKTFLLYFLASQVIVSILTILFKSVVKTIIIYYFKRKLKKGKIQLMSMDDFLNATNPDKKDGGTWH